LCKARSLQLEMKAILEFNLPEEKYEHESAISGVKYRLMVETIYDEVFRPHLKHDKPLLNSYLTNKEREVIEAIWNEIKEHIND
jgi:hypothetical protein